MGCAFRNEESISQRTLGIVVVNLHCVHLTLRPLHEQQKVNYFSCRCALAEFPLIVFYNGCDLSINRGSAKAGSCLVSVVCIENQKLKIESKQNCFGNWMRVVWLFLQLDLVLFKQFSLPYYEKSKQNKFDIKTTFISDRLRNMPVYDHLTCTPSNLNTSRTEIRLVMSFFRQ